MRYSTERLPPRGFGSLEPSSCQRCTHLIAELILTSRLQPEAREVVIVSGASVPFWEEEARRQLAPHLAPYKIRYLAGPTLR